VFIVKTFYQTSSFVTVQRVSDEIWQDKHQPDLQSELSGSVCNIKKGVVGRYRSACMHDSVAHLMYVKCCFVF